MKNKLLARFEKLSEGEQYIMFALSVIYTPIGQSRFQNLLKESGCVPTAISNIVAKPLREKLESLDLIELTSDGWICSRDISETLIKKAATDKPSFFAKLTPLALKDSGGYAYRSFHLHRLKTIRIYLYRQNETAFIKHFQHFENEYLKYLIPSLDHLFFQDFDEAWFRSLPIAIRLTVLQSYQIALRFNLSDCTFQYQLMNECFSEAKNIHKDIIYRYVKLHLIRGDLQGLETQLENDFSVYALELMGMLRFLENRYEEALLFYDAGLKQLKKDTRKRNISLGDFQGYFAFLTLLQSRTSEHLNTLRKQLEIAIKQHDWQDGFQIAENRLLKGLDVYLAKAKVTDDASYLLFQHNDFAYDRLFHALLLYWLGEIDPVLQRDPSIKKNLNSYCQQADKNGYVWFAAVSANLLKRLSAADIKTNSIAQRYSESKFNTIIDLLPRVEPWKRALDALTKLGAPDVGDATSSAKNKQTRMIWAVTMNAHQAFLTPREQRLGKNGRWTKGRPVAIKRLHLEPEKFDYLTDHDKRICQQIELGFEDLYYSYRPKEIYQLNERALVEAIGHPNVYWESAGSSEAPVNIATADLQLLVSEQKNQLLISISPTPRGQENYIVERAASDDILIYKVEPQHRQVVEILGQEGLLVPKKS